MSGLCYHVHRNFAADASIVGDDLFRISDPGIIRCWKVKDGELVYEKRAEQITPCANPVASADGRIYFTSSGKTYVIQAGPEFNVLAVNDLGEPNHASAAVSRGRMFLVGTRNLYCVGAK